MTFLDNCSLVCIDTKNKIEALLAIEKSISNIRFQYYKFFTNDISDIKISKFKNISNINLEIIIIPEIKSKVDYSKFCLIELGNYIETDYCLTIQHDGFIINPESWIDEFLEYDYIGAPWPSDFGYKNRVGNGGFCLKSIKFINICKELFKNWNFKFDRSNDDIHDNEDFLACVKFYDYMTANRIKFAPVELASKFSIEWPIQEMKEAPFGFHDKHSKLGKEILNKKYENII